MGVVAAVAPSPSNGSHVCVCQGERGGRLLTAAMTSSPPPSPSWWHVVKDSSHVWASAPRSRSPVGWSHETRNQRKTLGSTFLQNHNLIEFV